MWEEDPEGFSKKPVMQLVALYLDIDSRGSYLHCLYKLLTAILAVLFSAVLLHGQIFPLEIVFITRFLSTLIPTYLNTKLYSNHS